MIFPTTKHRSNTRELLSLLLLLLLYRVRQQEKWRYSAKIKIVSLFSVSIFSQAKKQVSNLYIVEPFSRFASDTVSHYLA